MSWTWKDTVVVGLLCGMAGFWGWLLLVRLPTELEEGRICSAVGGVLVSQVGFGGTVCISAPHVVLPVKS